MNLKIKPLGQQEWPALEDLFGRAGASNGCWCMYWRIGPRYRDRPRAQNKKDLEELASSGHRGADRGRRGVASTFTSHGFVVVARPNLTARSREGARAAYADMDIQNIYYRCL